MPYSSVNGKTTVDRHLRRLKPKSFLDIGAGSGTYSDRYRNDYPGRWVGLEIWQPYVEKFKLTEKYDQLILEDARTWEPTEKFDVCFMGDVMEHMTQEEAAKVVLKLLKWCTVIIVSVPIIHYPQGEYDGNPYEAHVKDDWSDLEAKQFFGKRLAHSEVTGEIGVYVVSDHPDAKEILKFKVALYTICKNEEQFVRRFMNSAKEADGVFVADTGSTDKTVPLLQSLGAKVITCSVQPWRFEIPRNISLNMVPLDYDACICIDLDEVLTPGWRRALEAAWTPRTTRMRYQYTWNTNPDGTDGVTFWYDKIHSRLGYRWIKPVHEILQCSVVETQTYCKDFKLRHFADSSKSRSSYLHLLEMGCREEPNDDRNSHYLGREYMFYGQYENGMRELKRHLSLPTARWDAERAASMRFIGRCCIGLGRDQEAIEWFGKACREAPGTREPHYELAKQHYKLGNHAETYNAAKACLAIVDRPAIYINEAEAWGWQPHDLLAVSAFYTGRKEEALLHTKRALELNPTDERLKNNVLLCE